MILEDSKELVKAARQVAGFLDGLERPVRVVAHYDCDGIASSIIAHEGLDRAGVEFDISYVEELNRDVLERLHSEAFEPVWLFVDIGSGQVADVEAVLESETVLIADHHSPGEGAVDYHVNPHDAGIDGGEDISGAGVTYLVMRLLDEGNRDLLKYALIGATGDIQTDADGYLGLNRELMEDAEAEGVITRKTGLKLYGRSGRSIAEALKYTTDPYLPGITNSESGAVQFLSELGIDLREDGEWRSLEDLSLEEEKAVVHGLIVRGYDVADLLGDIYILDNGWEIREFASLLNACGRLGRPEDGLKICLEDDFELAGTVKRAYGRKIGKYLSYVEDNMDDSRVVQDFGSGKVIVARDNIHANMIGTVTTICQKSDILEGGVLVGLAHKDEADIKISARASADAVADGVKMNEIVEEVATVCGGEGGGHEAAAGGRIPRDEQDRFIKMFAEVVDSERTE